MSDETLEQAIAQGQTDDLEPEVPVEPVEPELDEPTFEPDDEIPSGVPAEPAPEPPQAAAPPPPGYVDIPGVGQFRADDLVPIARAAQWARTNPDLWDRIVDQIEGPGPTPTPPIPDDEEYVDPDVAALRAELSELRTSHEQRVARDVARSVRRAATTFRGDHNDVDDALMERLWLHIRDNDWLPGYVDRADDEHDGTVAALSDAYRVLTYDNVRQHGARDAVQQIRARRRAAAASTRETSSRREEPTPQTSEERKNALVADLRDAMSEQATN